MTFTVIVPTYRRPNDLTRCLEALKRQVRLADEVLVVVRDTDTETWTALDTYNMDCLRLRTVMVKVPGVVAALNAGLEVAAGDIIAITDDDAAPHVDWLARLEAHYLCDSDVGGVGGRDRVYQGTQLKTGTRQVVGQLQWFGRIIGNHHLGEGAIREVDVLKAVNSSYRRIAIAGLRFDDRMRGSGAQVHFEIAFCLTLKRAGWKIIYDPLVTVDHYPAQRFDEDQRQQFNEIALANAVHNETIALLEHLPLTRRIVFLVWAVLIGTQAAPGFIQWLRFLPKERTLAGRKWLAVLRGRWQGWQSWQHSQDRCKDRCEDHSDSHSNPSLAGFSGDRASQREAE